jgi:hypothetical protein
MIRRLAIVKFIVATDVPGASLGINVSVGLLQTKIIKSVVLNEEKLFTSKIGRLSP